MRDVETKDLTVKQVMDLLLGGVSPRPIALVSTLSADRVPNLSPFSFFNAFGANPPVVAFSPSRRQRDNTTKDTYHNLMATGECVIQTVTHAMVHQVNLASTEYDPDVNEFVKSGLTPLKSDCVAPDRVAESPFQMECRLQQMINLGDGGGSGNLAVCEVIKFHVAEDLFDGNVIQPDRLDSVGRNSASYYTRASGPAIFAVAKPKGQDSIGFDRLPDFMRESPVYSRNNLGQFANCDRVPETEQVQVFLDSMSAGEAAEAAFYRYAARGDYRGMLETVIGLARQNHPKTAIFTELAAQSALEKGDSEFAWNAAMAVNLLAPKTRAGGT